MMIPGGQLVGLIAGGVALAAGIGAQLTAGNKKAAVSAETVNRLTASIDLSTPRKIVFGRTAFNTDIRDQEYTDDDLYLHRFIVCAAHAVESFDEIWHDDKLVWSAGTVQPDYVGWLEVEVREEGSAANAINISARMGTTRRYTGCAYVHFKYKMRGDDEAEQSPFGQSIPSRVTIIGKGAKVYNPQLDSTRGGAGAHRADDQATWEWDDDYARDPDLQEMWYLLGWKINGIISVGKGVNPDRIDWESVIDAVNINDESVSLAVGGTEPRYRSDGVFSEGDDPRTVISSLEAAGNSRLRDHRGKLSIKKFVNDLATPVATFNEDDVIGEFEWISDAGVDQEFNIVRGRYVDASDEALYQLIDYGEVSVASPDGIDRIDTFDLPTVQSHSQAMRLAKQNLQKSLYRRRLHITFGPRAWQITKDNVIELDFATLDFEEKLFRVDEYPVTMNGMTAVILREEHANLYAWDEEESPPVTAASPSTYDPFTSIIGEVIDEVIYPTNAGGLLKDPRFVKGIGAGTNWNDGSNFAIGATAARDGGPALVATAAGASNVVSTKLQEAFTLVPGDTIVGKFAVKLSASYNGTGDDFSLVLEELDIDKAGLTQTVVANITHIDAEGARNSVWMVDKAVTASHANTRYGRARIEQLNGATVGTATVEFADFYPGTSSAAVVAAGGVVGGPYIPTTRLVNAGTAMTGGGALSADITLSLADTAVTPGSYGDATHFTSFTVSQRGRLSAAAQFALGTGAFVTIANYALLASPVFTGNPEAPTQAGGNNTTRLATTAFVTAAISASPSGTVTSINVAGGTTGLTFSGGPITTSGTITAGGTLAIANGGTGATSASAARVALDLEIGVDVHEYNFELEDYIDKAELARASGTMPRFLYFNSGGFLTHSDSTATRVALGLGSIATQASSAVSITGGSVTGITDLAVADGGTGASTDSGARTNLGLGSIATQAAGAVAITGGSVTGITDIAVADGGTGSSTAGGALTNLGVTAAAQTVTDDATVAAMLVTLREAGVATVTGNGAQTWTYGTNAPCMIYSGSPGVVRAIELLSGAAGAKVRIVVTGAPTAGWDIKNGSGGATLLNMGGAGGVKEWADFEHDGSAWLLVAGAALPT